MLFPCCLFYLSFRFGLIFFLYAQASFRLNKVNSPFRQSDPFGPYFYVGKKIPVRERVRAQICEQLLSVSCMPLQREYRQRHRSLQDFPFVQKNIEQRYMQTRLASIAQRYPARSLELEKQEIARLLEAARQAGDWQLWRTTPPAP